VLVELQKPNLTDEEIQYATRKLGRQPNPVEWAMLEVEWSEHCSYKSSKQLLKLLPTKGSRVLVGPGFDAGVVDVGNGWVATFHIESHNHPSAIDPYGGAATGIGGVVRDILALGTRPVALLDSLHFGELEGNRTRWLLDNVVRGIADYGNCIGVPTVGGEVEFDHSFERNCLVDVACVGIGRKNKIVLAEARHHGDSVYLVGGSTGRDGIKGASFASNVLSERSDSERSAVQIPDPFMKKLIIEAILEAVDAGIVSGMKDLGGGGLACGLSELAAKGGTGIVVDLDLVALREPDMLPAEIMISESQERMLLVVKETDEVMLKAILEKYGVPHSKIGRVTVDGFLVVVKDGEVVARMPAGFVAVSPAVDRSTRKPSYVDQLKAVADPPIPDDLDSVILQLLGSPSIASKEWIYRQYDHEVGLRTIIKPGQADGAVLRLPNGHALAVTVDGNSKHCYLDPYWGTIGVASEACCNLVSVGAQPLAIVDHLQFGDPGIPEVYWTFGESVRGLASYLRAMRIPCVGGKVSFYNEDKEEGRAVKPSPVIAAIGLRDQETPKIGAALQSVRDDLIVVGTTLSELGGSEYYEHVHRLEGGRVPRVNVKRESTILKVLPRIFNAGGVVATHDCSKGGLAVCLAEMAIQGEKGFTVTLDRIPQRTKRIDQLLFSETRSRFILESQPKNTKRIMRILKRSRIPAAQIGRVADEYLDFQLGDESIISLPTSTAEQAWSRTIPDSEAPA
jgi:phosphoribosylformylglycinamidine synthase